MKAINNRMRNFEVGDKVIFFNLGKSNANKYIVGIIQEARGNKSYKILGDDGYTHHPNVDHLKKYIDGGVLGASDNEELTYPSILQNVTVEHPPPQVGTSSGFLGTNQRLSLAPQGACHTCGVLGYFARDCRNKRTYPSREHPAVDRFQ